MILASLSLYHNSKLTTMKVISKNKGLNRSTPALPPSGPKGTHKIKIFKHLLAQQMQSSNKNQYAIKPNNIPQNIALIIPSQATLASQPVFSARIAKSVKSQRELSIQLGGYSSPMPGDLTKSVKLGYAGRIGERSLSESQEGSSNKSIVQLSKSSLQLNKGGSWHRRGIQINKYPNNHNSNSKNASKHSKDFTNFKNQVYKLTQGVSKGKLQPPSFKSILQQTLNSSRCVVSPLSDKQNHPLSNNRPLPTSKPLIINKHADNPLTASKNPLLASKHQNKQNQGRRINHYKNTRLNYYKQTVKRKEVSMSDFKLGRRLGKGRFGSVFSAQDKATGMLVALKIVDLQMVRQQSMQTQLIEQIRLQMFMNHPNILKMYGCFKDKQQLVMILEYACDKCLFSQLDHPLPQPRVAYYTKQMLGALKYCHSECILHRDLKPQNILISFGVAKLADFGWAAYAPKYKRLTFCGTLDYVPPQIVKGQQYDQKVDIWSLGVLIYEMAVGRAPFQTRPSDPTKTQELTMMRILQGDLMVPVTLSGTLRELIYSILKGDPQARPTLNEIECSGWIEKTKEQGVQISRAVWYAWQGLSSK